MLEKRQKTPWHAWWGHVKLTWATKYDENLGFFTKSMGQVTVRRTQKLNRFCAFLCLNWALSSLIEPSCYSDACMKIFQTKKFEKIAVPSEFREIGAFAKKYVCPLHVCKWSLPSAVHVCKPIGHFVAGILQNLTKNETEKRSCDLHKKSYLVTFVQITKGNGGICTTYDIRNPLPFFANGVNMSYVLALPCLFWKVSWIIHKKNRKMIRHNLLRERENASGR